MTAVLFADFDGVLGAGRVWSQNAAKRWTCPAGWLDPLNVARLNRLCRRSGARVVVSSSWRRYLGAESVAGVLRACGFTGEVLGATPVLGRKPEKWRGLEVRRWLSERPHVTRWAVLDDLPVSVEAARLVRTDMHRGLTDEDVERAVAILTGGVAGALLGGGDPELLARVEEIDRLRCGGRGAGAEEGAEG